MNPPDPIPPEAVTPASPPAATSALLPYRDTKPQGAADFYFAINATFRFLLNAVGPMAWVAYLEELGRCYFEPVNEQWRRGGLPAVAAYWRAFFAAEPGAQVEVIERPDRVELQVLRCPAITHLRAGNRQIVREYCRHCYHLGNARATSAGLAMRLQGGNGACRHTFHRADAELPAQDLNLIREAE